MNGATGQPITFVIPGRRTDGSAATRGGAVPAAGPAAAVRPLPGGLRGGRVTDSVRVGANRDGGEVRVTAVPGEDVVVLQIAGGPALVLHPETARDLLAAQHDSEPSRGAQVTGDAAGTEVRVPAQLQWRGHEVESTTRGSARELFQGVVVSAVDIVKDALSGIVVDKAADLAAAVLARKVDAQVTPGVYKLQSGSLPSLKTASPATDLLQRDVSKPLLVLIHGTFSNTSSAFKKLWGQYPTLVDSLFEPTQYGDGVYALDHPTLSVSPIANALMLAAALPDNAKVHLVTHSRGGLVAEVLARMCGLAQLKPANGTPKLQDIAAFIGPQQQELRELAEVVARKKIQVDRIVRVACPARGTLLASKRVDAYLSVFKWTLELSGVPVLPELVDFLSAVAQRREDAEKLPGLEAQTPDSPLVRWLNQADVRIPGSLRVVAGDIEGDSVSSWLKTLLADSFYWTDNDFVVQTRSMYGGSLRKSGATFILDQNGKVSHSAYFANESTAKAVVSALVTDNPSDFRVVGPLSWAGKSSDGLRAAAAAGDGKGTSDKPILFVLPGLLGSQLTTGDGEPVWLTSRFASEPSLLAYDAANSKGIKATAFVPGQYDDLLTYLSATHEVVRCPYDWRIPLDKATETLAAAITPRLKDGRPIRILAHSSGCLLARTLQLTHRELWETMLEPAGARVLMLGPPNGGLWTPMQVLSGDDTFGGTLTAGAGPFGDAAVRSVMGSFPGFMQLQAGLTDPGWNLERRATWEQLATADLARALGASSWHTQKTRPLQEDAYRWGIPTEEALAAAVSLRRSLDKQVETDLPGFASRLAIVAGKAPFTPRSFENTGANGLSYLDISDGGDGRVTLQSALLPGVATWTADRDHGGLASYKEVFPLYAELLQTGRIQNGAKLLTAVDTQRGAGTVSLTGAPTRSRPSRRPATVRPPEHENELFSARRPRAERTPGPALHVSVINGDLSFVRQPLLLGHYRSMRLTGTEYVMDALIGQTMRNSLAIGLYPDAPGTHQLFVNIRRDYNDATRIPRPESVVVVGLGEEGKLSAVDLVRTIRQGVIAWAERVAEKPGAPAVFDLAATLIGSGGKGIAVAQSAQLVAEGVREAHVRLASGNWPRVGRLQIIELYLDRAAEALQALKLQAESSPECYVVGDTVLPGNGGLRRPLDQSYRPTAYDFVTAVMQNDEQGTRSISYSLDTKRARTEVTAQATQLALLRELIGDANRVDGGRAIGRPLFNVLVPPEIEPFLGDATEMVIELDRATAAIPWELLDTDTGARSEGDPWAIRAKLLRKLRTTEFRQNVTDASTDESVLVIGEPASDPKKYAPLPAARREAVAVGHRLSSTGALRPDRIRVLVSEDEDLPGPDTTTVLSALHERPWRIVHISGHGEPPHGNLLGGVVLSPSKADGAETYLGPTEIHNMRVVPELVFINCCHLGAVDPADLAGNSDRPRFAATVAEELIKIGVRCVIAAGWAVADEAAKAFADKFYDAILGYKDDTTNRPPDRFMDAVARARRAAREFGGSTWAAYQCYGDPDWTFAREVADNHEPPSPAHRFAGVTSPLALKLALETIVVETKFQKKPAAGQLVRIRYLEDRFGALWGDIGDIAEAFATARAEIGSTPEAIAWYERALAAGDGTASMRAVEQLANLRVRLAWKTVESIANVRAQDSWRAAISGSTGAARSALPSEERDRLEDARTTIAAAIGVLHTTTSIAASVERWSLIGSAYKRLAMIEAAAGRQQHEEDAIDRMRDAYAKAEQLGSDNGAADVFYPALNCLAAELATRGRKRPTAKGRKAAGAATWSLSEARVELIRDSLAAKIQDDPDFWSLVGETELGLYQALARNDLGSAIAAIERGFEDLHQRVSAPKSWASVHDNATFVLGKYCATCAPAEKAAAQRVLQLLGKMAGAGTPEMKASGSRAVARKPAKAKGARPVARKSPARPRRA